MKKYIMAIDQGTTSTRAILFDHDSNMVGIAQKEIENYYPHPGWVEQNANDVWASTVGVMFEVLAKTGIKEEEIAAIGITNQRETTVVWDKQSGQPIYFAIVWQSRQSNSYCEKFKQEEKEEWIKEKCGLLLDPYFSASKIRWILDHVEGAQEKAERGELFFGTMDCWLLWKLTKGECHMSDVSNVSRTMLMNLDTLQYDEELLKLWNIPRCMLPKIVDSSSIYGYVKGLFSHSIPIASMIGDQQAALFGQTCFEAGSVKNTYGTGCFLLMNTKDKRIHSKHGLLTCAGWSIQGKCTYVLEGSVFIAGAVIQWLRDNLQIISKSSESEKMAVNCKDNGGIVFVPSFTGLGAPYWKPDVKGAIFGLTRGTSKEQIVRAALESLAFQTNDVLCAMQEDSAMKIEKLQVDGGASTNSFLLQFQSDITNTKVVRPMIFETTALGAAYLAGLACGFWKNQEEIRQYFQVSAKFIPMMDEQKRKENLEQWKKAIGAVLQF